MRSAEIDRRAASPWGDSERDLPGGPCEVCLPHNGAPPPKISQKTGDSRHDTGIRTLSANFSKNYFILCWMLLCSENENVFQIYLNSNLNSILFLYFFLKKNIQNSYDTFSANHNSNWVIVFKANLGLITTEKAPRFALW